MKLKSVIIFSLFSVSAAHAAGNAYIGGDIALANETELDALGVKFSDNNDMGFNLAAGYAFDVSPEFKIGMEGEYRSFGDVTFFNVLKGSGSAFFVNAKPMYYFNENIYFGATLGVGQMKLELEDLVNNIKDSESDTGYQFGLELGYVLDSGLGLNVGYRTATADIEGIDTTISGVHAGLRYNF